MEKIKAKDILLEEYNKYFKSFVLTKIEIDFLNGLPDRQMVIGRKSLNDRGDAFQNVSVEQMQKEKEETFNLLKRRIDTVQWLLDEKDYRF